LPRRKKQRAQCYKSSEPSRTRRFLSAMCERSVNESQQRSQPRKDKVAVLVVRRHAWPEAAAKQPNRQHKQSDRPAQLSRNRCKRASRGLPSRYALVKEVHDCRHSTRPQTENRRVPPPSSCNRLNNSNRRLEGPLPGLLLCSGRAPRT